METDTTGPLLNRAAIMAMVDNDRELLRSIAALFLEKSSEMLTEIRRAITASDGEALSRVAHKLKGAGGHFLSTPAKQEAHRLEMMGREGDFNRAQEALAALEQEMMRASAEIAALADD